MNLTEKSKNLTIFLEVKEKERIKVFMFMLHKLVNMLNPVKVKEVK